MKINMRTILPLFCWTLFLHGAASASELRAILGPAVMFEEPRSYGAIAGLMVHLHLSAGLAYNMEKSSVEVRWSPGGVQAEIYESSSLWVGWRLPISKPQSSDRRRSDGSIPLGI